MFSSVIHFYDYEQSLLWLFFVINNYRTSRETSFQNRSFSRMFFTIFYYLFTITDTSNVFSRSLNNNNNM